MIEIINSVDNLNSFWVVWFSVMIVIIQWIFIAKQSKMYREEIKETNEIQKSMVVEITKVLSCMERLTSEIEKVNNRIYDMKTK